MPDRNSPEETERLATPAIRHELQRIQISAPAPAPVYEGRTPPRPVNLRGERIQVTCHTDELGQIVERWQFSETDVRWYRLEYFRTRWVTLKMEKRVPGA